MKNSFRAKLTIILVVSVFSAIFLCWFFTYFFLGKFYKKSKVKSLSLVYENLCGFDYSDIENDNVESRAYEQIENLSAGHDVDIYVLGKRDSFFGSYEYYFIYPSEEVLIDRRNNYERVRRSISYYLFGQKLDVDSRVELVDSIENRYDINELIESGSRHYLDLIGFITDDYVVFVRTNYESIELGTKISVSFLKNVGIIVTFIAACIMLLISKKLTDRVISLSVVANSISNLNFEMKCDESKADEIGILAHSINSLSDKLRVTISELKSANNELERDIARKNETDEMRRDFISSVSHELKTPIALIQGYAEGLRDNVNDDEESRNFYCEVIIDEADKMNKMVKKLLTLSQLESDSQALCFERFNLSALIAACVSSFDVIAKQNHISISTDIGENVFVWADEYMIEEVIMNYLSNAVHHCEGEKLIRVSCNAYEEMARISVFNTGRCIPAEELTSIWEKFYKVDKARTREYGGSGLGLSIVKAIAKQHNQSCGVCNEVNGVTFWFDIDITN